MKINSLLHVLAAFLVAVGIVLALHNMEKQRVQITNTIYLEVSQMPKNGTPKSH